MKNKEIKFSTQEGDLEQKLFELQRIALSINEIDLNEMLKLTDSSLDILNDIVDKNKKHRQPISPQTDIVSALMVVQEFLVNDSDLQKAVISGKAIVEDYLGGNNRWNMQLLSPKEAIENWNSEAPIVELYQLYDDGSESLIDGDEEFKTLLETEEWFGVDDD